jgi:hypothetical protein
METNELITKETLERNGFVFVEEYGMMRWMEDLGSRNGGFEVCWTEDLNLLQIRGKGFNLDFFSRCMDLTGAVAIYGSDGWATVE